MLIGGLFVLILLALLYVSSDSVKILVDPIVASIVKYYYLWIFISIGAIVVLCILRNILFNHEPFSFSDGISIWPTEILRALAALLSLFFIFKVQLKIKAVNNSVQHKSGENRRNLDKKAFFLTNYWTIENGKGNAAAVSVNELWQEYLDLGNFTWCAKRTGIHMAVFAVFFLLLKWVLGYLSIDFGLFTPARGNVSFWVNDGVLCIAVLSMLFLTFLVVDRHRLYRRYIQLISQQDKIWQECDDYNIANIEQAYQNVLHIAKYTESIKFLNVFSFIVLFLMIIARNDYFDKWNMNLTLLSIFVSLGIYSFACTIILHGAAKRYKDDIVAALHRKVVFLDTKNEERIKFIIDAMEYLRKGAFRPLSQQFLIQAALLPFSGASSLVLIDILSK